MDTVELARLLIEKKGLSVKEFAEECNISRQTFYNNLNSVRKNKGEHNFHLGVLTFAFNNGHQAEVLAILSGKLGGKINKSRKSSKSGY